MPERKKVWIDTDVAIGMGDPKQGFADVDDAWAMIHLFHAPQVEVKGISIKANEIKKQLTQAALVLIST